MPTYEYECKDCGERFERRQHMTDKSVTECPACSGVVRKVLQSFAVSVKAGGGAPAPSPCADGGCPFAGQCGIN